MKRIVSTITLWFYILIANAAGGLSEASDSEMLGFFISALISILIIPMGLVHGYDRIGLFAYLHIPLIVGVMFLFYMYLRNLKHGKLLKSIALVFSYMLITFTTNILIKKIWYG